MNESVIRVITRLEMLSGSIEQTSDDDILHHLDISINELEDVVNELDSLSASLENIECELESLRQEL